MIHIINSEQFTKESLKSLFDLTDKIKKKPLKFKKKLKGRVVATLFYEPSTRTRFSFESAISKLGASYISLCETSSTSIVKGETFEDTIKVLSSYTDALIIRHSDVDSAYDAAIYSKVPVINAGAGNGEHPTQALLDLYTIRENKKRLNNLKVAIIGDLLNGRTIHSLVKLLSLYDNVIIYGLSNKDFSLPNEIIKFIKRSKNKYIPVESFDELPNDIDILYQTRLQKERLTNSKAKAYNFDINSKVMEQFCQDTIILHPLPRNGEIDIEVDEDPRALYFEQATNGMYVRMALLLKVIKNNL